MARIGGINVPDDKQVFASLQSIYGVGKSTALKICKDTGIDPQLKLANVSVDDVAKLREAVSGYTIEGNLRRQVSMYIKRLIDLSCYRGIRHKKSLPVRGQNTRSNARTRKRNNRKSK